MRDIYGINRSDVYIKNCIIPDLCSECFCVSFGVCTLLHEDIAYGGKRLDCPLIEIPTPHGRLIDADAIQNEMYRKSFETDDERQKWDSGLWIRYKIFEESINNVPTVIESNE